VSYGVRLEVWGDFACFTRPELKVERFSYPVITPSAARGVLEALFWHNGLKWVIDRLYVLSKIQYANIRRNELKAKISASNVVNFAGKGQGELYLSARENIQQSCLSASARPDNRNNLIVFNFKRNIGKNFFMIIVFTKILNSYHLRLSSFVFYHQKIKRKLCRKQNTRQLPRSSTQLSFHFQYSISL